MEEEIILSQIIEDAQKEANRIREEAESLAKKIEEENTEKARREMQEKFEIIKSKIMKDSMAEVEKAEFEARSVELIERKRIIEIVKEKVKQKIKDMDENTYISAIDEKISGYKNAPNVQLVLPAKCYSQIKQLATGYGMEVNEPTDEFDSGVIVKCGNIEYNYNFEENMAFLDEEIEKEIDTIIFS